MIEAKTSASLHRHPSMDRTWHQVRLDIGEYTTGIDRNWTGHIDKVVLDFSGYWHEFDSSSMYDRHNLHQPDSSPDIHVTDEALIGTKQGVLVTWKKGTTENIQLSEDLVNWESITYRDALDILSDNHISLPDSGEVGQSIAKHCQNHRITQADVVGKLATCPALFERCVIESSPEWQLNHEARGFKSVTRRDLVVFTITPLEIVYWNGLNTPEPLSENEAIGQLRCLIQAL